MATQDDIITLPHDNLHQRSVRVRYVTDDINQLISDMSEALLDWEAHREHEVGVALAAVQINQLKRVVIVRNDTDNKDDRRFIIFINPEITKYEGEQTEDHEGCLSVKDIYGKVPRYEKIKVKALDIKGREFRVTLDGFLARTLQHEIDHTNGILFVDHIKGNPDAFFRLEENGDLTKLDYETEVQHDVLWEHND